MTVTVRIDLIDVVNSTPFEADMAVWMAPYVDAGSTGPFPATNVSGGTFYREWDTLENAQAYINKMLEYPSQIGAATIV